MSAPGESRSFVVSMSLIELAFILFFLLLLLAIDRDNIRRAEAAELAERVEGFRENEERWNDFMDALESSPLSGKALSEDFFQKLVRNATEAEGLRSQKESLSSQLHDAKEQLKASEGRELESEKRRAAVVGQFARLRNQCGVGFPPCWLNGRGEIEYIYQVSIYEDSITVEPAWPAHREAELADILGSRSLIGANMSFDEFRGPAQEVLDWSEKQEPACRHYVILRDRAETKDGYKLKRLFIENFFYKFESRS